MKKLLVCFVIAGLGAPVFAIDPDYTSREAWRVQTDTNETTIVTSHTASGPGQMLSGKVGGSNAIWIATAAGTQSWVKAVQSP